VSLVRAEYRKITRRKVYPVMSLLLVAFVGLGAFFLIVFGEIAPEAAEGLPVLEKPVVYEVGAQQAATQFWFPLILAVVLLGGELSTTVWATSLTRESRKVRQIGARFGPMRWPPLSPSWSLFASGSSWPRYLPLAKDSWRRRIWRDWCGSSQ
jgi:hypothetical protein